MVNQAISWARRRRLLELPLLAANALWSTTTSNTTCARRCGRRSRPCRRGCGPCWCSGSTRGVEGLRVDSDGRRARSRGVGTAGNGARGGARGAGRLGRRSGQRRGRAARHGAGVRRRRRAAGRDAGPTSEGGVASRGSRRQAGDPRRPGPAPFSRQAPRERHRFSPAGRATRAPPTGGKVGSGRSRHARRDCAAARRLS